MNKPSIRISTALIAVMAILSPLGLAGQDEAPVTLAPGDVVRVNQDFVGTLMSMEAGQLTVLGEGEPVCYAGIQHGEAPRCDPAPPIRRVVQWDGAMIERQQLHSSYTTRMAIGFLIGAAIGTPIGWATGPDLGYGKVGHCTEPREAVYCKGPITWAEFDRLQKLQDQQRGALFFGVVTGTVGAILARRMADEWIEVYPPGMTPSGGWDVGFKLEFSN